MKLLLEVNDNKADFLLEILKNFSFVKKATPLTDVKAQQIKDLKEAIDELNLVKKGKLKGIPANELLDEL